jgi:hypothetical protein
MNLYTAIQLRFIKEYALLQILASHSQPQPLAYAGRSHEGYQLVFKITAFETLLQTCERASGVYYRVYSCSEFWLGVVTLAVS